MALLVGGDAAGGVESGRGWDLGGVGGHVRVGRMRAISAAGLRLSHEPHQDAFGRAAAADGHLVPAGFALPSALGALPDTADVEIQTKPGAFDGKILSSLAGRPLDFSGSAYFGIRPIVVQASSPTAARHPPGTRPKAARNRLR